MNRETVLLHGGRPNGKPGEPVVAPIVPSVNYVMPPGIADDVRYAGYANTPAHETLQRRLAELEGTESAIVAASGSAATAATMLALLRPGDHLLSSSWIYGGTRQFFERELLPMGIDVTFIDPTETRAWRRELRRTTRVLFLESPVNPTTRVLDLRPPRMLAQEHGVVLVVDSTFATPINTRPVEHGADVVIHSATKYLNGHNDTLAGVVCGASALIDEVRAKMSVWGQAPDAFALWLLERGLKTLDVRVRRQNDSAMRLAEWACGNTAFTRVLYPGLPSHPDHEVARATLDGFGGIVGLVLAGGADEAARVASRLTVIQHANSLGGVESVVSEPRLTSHRALTSAERAALGIPDGFLRLSVGLENADDLIADLAHAVEL